MAEAVDRSAARLASAMCLVQRRSASVRCLRSRFSLIVVLQGKITFCISNCRRESWYPLRSIKKFKTVHRWCNLGTKCSCMHGVVTPKLELIIILNTVKPLLYGQHLCHQIF